MRARRRDSRTCRINTQQTTGSYGGGLATTLQQQELRNGDEATCSEAEKKLNVNPQQDETHPRTHIHSPRSPVGCIWVFASWNVEAPPLGGRHA